jgi:hypothetical protein
LLGANFKKRFILVSCLGLAAVGARYLLISYHNKKQVSDRLITYEVYNLAMDKLHKAWTMGSSGDELKCDNFELARNVDQQYLQCNPDYFQCFMSSKGLKIKHSRHEYTIKSIENYKVITGANFGYVFKLKISEIDDSQLRIKLQNTCYSTYLPNRKYSYGPVGEKQSGRKKINELKNWLWDNFDRHIYIDKYLVTNRDINEWIKTEKLNKNLIEQKKGHFPSVGLTREEQKKFCHYKGKNLLEAHLYDASSFIPFNEDNPNPKLVKKSPYPWNRDKRRSIFRRTQLNAYDDSDITKNICSMAYVSNCKKKYKYNPFSSNSVTWMGIYNVLGGPLESFFNPLESEKNLKLSSYYFKLNSKAHNIGERGEWNGEIGKSGRVDWDLNERNNIETSGPWEIGFRCYAIR